MERCKELCVVPSPHWWGESARHSLPKAEVFHQRPPEWDSREDLFLDEGAPVVSLH